MGTVWVWVSGFAFLIASLCLLLSAYYLWRIARNVLPLLEDTRTQVQDLGDLAANTVGRANDAMELVELRVSQTMGQAAQAGEDMTRQAIGVGSVLAGLYAAARIAQTLRGYFGVSRKRARRRR